MIYFDTNSNKPEFNLACEEYFMKNYREPVLILWQNEPTIVVGRFQNTLEEVNEAYVTQNNINVIRRMTGGGAVYHDMGNLCYSFIVRGVSSAEADFSVFAKPVVEALQSLGVDAYTSGRNDILIDEKKISGTAMSLHRGSLLFHGTLLFDSDLTVLSEALKVNPLKIASKSSKSVRSRVTNIAPYLKEGNEDVQTFKKVLQNKLMEAFACEEYQLTYEDIWAIEKLAEEKYKSWAWNIGKNPEYSYSNTKKFDGGLLEVHLDVKKGLVHKAFIRGDFLGLRSLDELQEALTQKPYDMESLGAVLDGFDLKEHFNGITKEEILSCMFAQ